VGPESGGKGTGECARDRAEGTAEVTGEGTGESTAEGTSVAIAEKAQHHAWISRYLNAERPNSLNLKMAVENGSPEIVKPLTTHCATRLMESPQQEFQ
jgi:hypothetical protein